MGSLYKVDLMQTSITITVHGRCTDLKTKEPTLQIVFKGGCTHGDDDRESLTIFSTENFGNRLLQLMQSLVQSLREELKITNQALNSTNNQMVNTLHDRSTELAEKERALRDREDKIREQT